MVVHLLQPPVQRKGLVGGRGAGAEREVKVGVPEVDRLSGQRGLAQPAHAPQQGHGLVGLLAEDAAVQVAQFVRPADEQFHPPQFVGQMPAHPQPVGGLGAAAPQADGLGSLRPAEEGGGGPVVGPVAAPVPLPAGLGPEAAQGQGGRRPVQEHVPVERLGQVEGEPLLDGVAHGDHLRHLGPQHGEGGAGVVGQTSKVSETLEVLGSPRPRHLVLHPAHRPPQVGDLALQFDLPGVAGGEEDQVGRGGETAAQQVGDLLAGDVVVPPLLVLQHQQVLVAVGEEVDDVVAPAAAGGALQRPSGHAVLQHLHFDLVLGRQVLEEEEAEALAHIAHGQRGLSPALGEC